MGELRSANPTSQRDNPISLLVRPTHCSTYSPFPATDDLVRGIVSRFVVTGDG
jgi:hypothetical protein